jgi:hypothetical protein
VEEEKPIRQKNVGEKNEDNQQIAIFLSHIFLPSRLLDRKM